MSPTTAIRGAHDAPEPVVALPDPASDRAMLAAELHDLVTHQATVVAVQLAAAQAPPEPGDREPYVPLDAALLVLEDMGADLRRLGRLLAAHRPVPLEPVPSVTALLARLADPDAELVALRRLPAGVVVCAYRCLELLEDHGGGAVRVSTPQPDLLVLDARFPGPAVDRQELGPRVRVRLEPCSGRLRVLAPDHWRLELPLKA